MLIPTGQVITDDSDLTQVDSNITQLKGGWSDVNGHDRSLLTSVTAAGSGRVICGCLSHQMQFGLSFVCVSLS